MEEIQPGAPPSIVSNVVPGEPPIIITCSVQVGDVLIHNVSMRLGRRQTTYINLPAMHKDDRWRPLVEITQPDLLEQVRQAVVTAALEATRHNLLIGDPT